MLRIRALLLMFSFALAFISNGQIVDGNAYLIGERVEIAVHGNAGHEGTLDWPGHHSRGGTEDVPFGFVANPLDDGWVDYDGDFFTAGTPENGFGIEINGSNYSNNGWNSTTSTVFLSQIPTAPGGTITHTIEDNCITVEWEGVVSGVTINVKYHLIATDLFYTTEITMTNGTGSNLSDVYYYRNVDPDNNEALTGVFATTNTIVSQPSPDCIKALVSAEQASPFPSYLGLGGLGDEFRVTHGGFSNRSGSDIWNAAGGLTGTLGAVDTDDKSISLAYKTDIPAGGTVNFSYAVVLNEAALEAAFSSLYFINYETSSGVGGGILNPCSPAVVEANSCRGNDVVLIIDGPDVEGYDWVWEPGGFTGDTIIVSPGSPGIYTVTGTPTSPCLIGTIVKKIEILFTEGPLIELGDEGYVCMEFNLDTLDWENPNMNEHTDCYFLTEEPDSAGQYEPAFEGPVMEEGDLVWLVCYDSTTGCYDYARIDLNWVGPGSAGHDTSMTVCGGPGTVFHLGVMISDSANTEGYFEEITESGGLIDSTGLYNGSGFYGTFVFRYITPGLAPCIADTAIFTITILEQPFANYEYLINGLPSLDGITSGCLSSELEFENLSTIEDPGEIVEWFWSYGDGETSDEWDAPPHAYAGAGTYIINLAIISDNGCASAINRLITIYEFPPLDFVYTEPVCFGYEDGLITVIPDSSIGPYTIIIEDEDGNILNEGGGVTADSLGEGTYYISIEDILGCVSYEEVTLNEPPFMDVWYRIIHPACNSDSGWVVVDSVAGESDNNPIRYTWDPNPAGIEGIGADSSYWMKAGDYTLTVTDSKGCFNIIDLTLIDPPPFYFTDWGWDTAYCRLYDYQSGNGFVWAAAAGGVPSYTYEWTYLIDGSTSNNTTWGGRNPGDHLISVTDAFGCQLTKIVTVDSVNPIASFTTESAMLNMNCEGTADVEVKFTNTSQYYANPNNPDADTLFMWDLDRSSTDSWTICNDFFEVFDTTYEARGASYQVDVCLIAFNKNGCRDTACKTITIWEPPELSPVNVFTPNGNGTNDVFTFKNFQKGIRDFNCVIVNRWGVTVGEINEITGFWNGINFTGDLCPNGVYFYNYVATADNGEEFSGQGTVTLLSGRGQ